MIHFFSQCWFTAVWCDMTHSFVSHSCVAWRIHRCDISHSYTKSDRGLSTLKRDVSTLKKDLSTLQRDLSTHKSFLHKTSQVSFMLTGHDLFIYIYLYLSITHCNTRYHTHCNTSCRKVWLMHMICSYVSIFICLSHTATHATAHTATQYALQHTLQHTLQHQLQASLIDAHAAIH